MAVSKVYSLMRMRPGEVCWYKRHPVFDETEHVGWRNGTIAEHGTFRFYEHPEKAPSNADFVDSDGNIMEYEDVLEAYDAAIEAEKAEHPELYAEKPRRGRGRRSAVDRRRPSARKATRKKVARKKAELEPVSETADEAEADEAEAAELFGGQ